MRSIWATDVVPRAPRIGIATALLLLGTLVGAGSTRVVLAEPPVEHKRIPADMLADVNAAVKKAADFLRSRQEADGSWTFGPADVGPARPSMDAWKPAFSCMVGVALARAGARQDDPVVARLTAYLSRTLAARSAPGSRSTFLAKTYGASAFLWFLAESKSPALRADASSAALALKSGAAEGGLWGYDLPDVVVHEGYGRVDRLARAATGPADLSNSQFAVLGLLSAERLGILQDDGTWTRVRNAFRKIARRDGGFPYRFGAGEPEAFTRENRTSTAIGAACSFLALRRTGATEEAATADPTLRGALRWLEKHPVVARAGNVDTSEPFDIGIRLPYYDLVALERLGAFTGLDQLAGMDWYRVGGRFLLSTQRQDGGWPDGTGGQRHFTSTLNAVFAIIFLTRAAADFSVTTPSVTPADVAGLAEVVEPLFTESALRGVAAAAREAAVPESAQAWRNAFFTAGVRVVGVLVSRLSDPDEAVRGYVLGLLPQLIDPAAGPREGVTAQDWRSWFGTHGGQLRSDAATRRFMIDAK